MKLYTRTGDDGTTGLIGAKRVDKDSLPIETCGAIDELNCAVGMVQVVCRHDELSAILRQLQDRLFELGADVAAASCDDAHTPRVNEQHIQTLERQIDATCESLAPMKNFILPGGCELSARVHLARSICRRAERHAVALARTGHIHRHVHVWLNRLSDLLFAMARQANQIEGVDDVPWTG